MNNPNQQGPSYVYYQPPQPQAYQQPQQQPQMQYRPPQAYPQPQPQMQYRPPQAYPQPQPQMQYRPPQAYQPLQQKRPFWTKKRIIAAISIVILIVFIFLIMYLNLCDFILFKPICWIKDGFSKLLGLLGV